MLKSFAIVIGKGLLSLFGLLFILYTIIKGFSENLIQFFENDNEIYIQAYQRFSEHNFIVYILKGFIGSWGITNGGKSVSSVILPSLGYFLALFTIGSSIAIILGYFILRKLKTFPGDPFLIFHGNRLVFSAFIVLILIFTVLIPVDLWLLRLTEAPSPILSLSFWFATLIVAIIALGKIFHTISKYPITEVIHSREEKENDNFSEVLNQSTIVLLLQTG